MTKVYLIAEDCHRRVITAVLDLHDLPLGVAKNILRDWDEDGQCIACSFNKESGQAARFVNALRRKKMDSVSLAFFTNLASFADYHVHYTGKQWDFILGSIGTHTDFVKASSEFADCICAGMRRKGAPWPRLSRQG